MRAHEATREKSKRRVTNPTALKAKGEAAEARVSAARSAAARSAAARSAAVPLVAASVRHESREVWRRECRHRDPTVRRRTDRRPRSLVGPGWELSSCSSQCASTNDMQQATSKQRATQEQSDAMAEGAAAGAMDGGEKMRCVLRERHWRRGACSRWRARTRARCTPPPGAAIAGLLGIGGHRLRRSWRLIVKVLRGFQTEPSMIPGHRGEHDRSGAG